MEEKVYILKDYQNIQDLLIINFLLYKIVL